MTAHQYISTLRPHPYQHPRAVSMTIIWKDGGGGHLVATGAVQDLCLTLNNEHGGDDNHMIWKSDHPLFPRPVKCWTDLEHWPGHCWRSPPPSPSLHLSLSSSMASFFFSCRALPLSVDSISQLASLYFFFASSRFLTPLSSYFFVMWILTANAMEHTHRSDIKL